MFTRIMLVALVLTWGPYAHAEETTFKKTKMQTIQDGKQKFVDVHLRIEAHSIVLIDKKGSATRAEIPYDQVTAMTYEKAERRRTAEGAAIMVASLGAGAVVMFTKSKSHWLTITHGENTELHETVLRLHKKEYRKAIAALESVSGKPVDILSEEERKTASRLNPTEGSENVDESVPYSLGQVRAAVRHAMEKYGCQIKKDEENKIECKRGRGENEAQGGGGEKVTAKLKAEGDSTRISVKTGKGFVGRLLKKNWSTPIFEEMMTLLETSS